MHERAPPFRVTHPTPLPPAPRSMLVDRSLRRAAPCRCLQLGTYRRSSSEEGEAGSPRSHPLRDSLPRQEKRCSSRECGDEEGMLTATSNIHDRSDPSSWEVVCWVGLGSHLDTSWRATYPHKGKVTMLSENRVTISLFSLPR